MKWMRANTIQLLQSARSVDQVCYPSHGQVNSLFRCVLVTNENVPLYCHQKYCGWGHIFLLVNLISSWLISIDICCSLCLANGVLLCHGEWLQNMQNDSHDIIFLFYKPVHETFPHFPEPQHWTDREGCSHQGNTLPNVLVDLFPVTLSQVPQQLSSCCPAMFCSPLLSCLLWESCVLRESCYEQFVLSAVVKLSNIYRAWVFSVHFTCVCIHWLLKLGRNKHVAT